MIENEKNNEDIENLMESFTKKIRRCPFCGNKTFIINKANQYGIIGLNARITLPVVAIVCSHCGHIDFFNIKILQGNFNKGEVDNE